MKKLFMVVVALLYSFIGANIFFAEANTWTQKADVGGAVRDGAVGFSIGSKGYIGTGENEVYTGGMWHIIFYKDFWEYDPVTNIWTQKADVGGTVRYGAVGFSIGSKGYIGTGSYAGKMKDFWEYDPAANAWTQKADFGGIARNLAVGFSIGNKGYIGTGSGSGARQKDFWEYDPATDTWTQKSDFGGTARMWAVGFSIGSKGYIGTGSTVSSPSFNKEFWEYNPATDTWTQKSDFGGTARDMAVGFSIGSKGYIGTGFDSYSYIPGNNKDFWEYDPAADTWTRRADFGGTTRHDAVGFSIGSKGYIGTGYSSPAHYKDFWEYEPNAADTTPDQFTFNYEVDVDLNTVVTSNTITVSGINAPVPISVTGGSYSINGGAYTNAAGTVKNGDKITVQVTSSAYYATTTEATLTIGGVSDTFSVTTKEESIISLNPVANRTILWAPNNKMVPIIIKANASDSSGEPVTLSVTVSCNEPAGLGRDWTKPVINQKKGIINLSLRATRLGNGTGRIYTITITATGVEGNSVTKSITITVPHDKRK